jgi:hypothetical protein
MLTTFDGTDCDNVDIVCITEILLGGCDTVLIHIWEWLGHASYFRILMGQLVTMLVDIVSITETWLDQLPVTMCQKTFSLPVKFYCCNVSIGKIVLPKFDGMVVTLCQLML